MFNLSEFISKYVIKRPKSLFLKDIESKKKELRQGIENKRVLVIGGAGSIGSSFIKEVLAFRPKSLVVVDINENSLAELTRDLRSTEGLFIPDDYMTYPINYSGKVFKKMFKARSGFDIVANFSAHKHVRSEKDVFSVEALLTNNVFNARDLLELLSEYPPEHFFCVSTDKAANPVNIMGASKKLMEELIFSYRDKFKITTARFANVAFSNGSLPAGFLQRIEKQQPISAPEDVRRYFVSPEESGQICMCACILGNNGDIFFPKLKEEQMMKFSDIARQLLAEKGYDIRKCASESEAVKAAADLKSGSKSYPVYFSPSDTSGEKAYEEFFTSTEKVDTSSYEAFGVISGNEYMGINKIDEVFSNLKKAFSAAQPEKGHIVKILGEALGTFDHIETNKSLDEKM